MKILLSAYIDGEVTPSEAVRVEDHLAGCEECVGELRSLRATSSLLRSLPELEAPRSFALTEAPAPVGFAPQLVWTTRFATSLAALFLVSLLLGDVLGFVGQAPQRGSQRQASSTVQAPAAPAPAAPAEALDSGLAGLPGSPGNPGLAPAPAAAAAEPAPAAPAPAPPAPAASAPAPPAAPAPAAAEPLAPSLEARAMPTPAAPALAAAETETAGETEDMIASRTLAAPTAPDVEEPSPEVELAAAPERPTQVTTSQSAIDESVEKAEKVESLAAPAPSRARDLPAPAAEESAGPVDEPLEQVEKAETLAAPQPSPERSLPPPATEESAETLDEPVVGAAAAWDEISEGDAARGLAIPVRELEIVLGVLVALLLAVTYWVARRGVG